MGNAPKGVRLIDLGLPSGTKWSNMDIGAPGENQPGLFFAFGETEGYSYETHAEHSFSWESYKWGGGCSTNEGITKYQVDDHHRGCWYSAEGQFIGDGKDKLEPEDDAAVVLWAGKWRMPTDLEMQELHDNCTTELMSIDGQAGRLFTSRINGNTIFFPFAGDVAKDEVKARDERGYYWSNKVAANNTSSAIILFVGLNTGVFPAFRFAGRCIRPVQTK